MARLIQLILVEKNRPIQVIATRIIGDLAIVNGFRPHHPRDRLNWITDGYE